MRSITRITGIRCLTVNKVKRLSNERQMSLLFCGESHAHLASRPKDSIKYIASAEMYCILQLLRVENVRMVRVPVSANTATRSPLDAYTVPCRSCGSHISLAWECIQQRSHPCDSIEIPNAPAVPSEGSCTAESDDSSQRSTGSILVINKIE
jgi:hypothetical protein